MVQFNGWGSVGTCQGFGFGSSSGSNDNLIDVAQWGAVKLHNYNYKFYNCTNLAGFSAIDTPDLSGITNFCAMFYRANIFNGDLSGWDVSNVTYMDSMFAYAENFNSDLSGWDVSNVTDMSKMFWGTVSFNADISDWDVSSVKKMEYMFMYNTNFNCDLYDWDVSNVTNMSEMFNGAQAFNADLSNWDVSNVTNMGYMFYYATSFNNKSNAAGLDDWDVSASCTTTDMFTGCAITSNDLPDWYE